MVSRFVLAAVVLLAAQLFALPAHGQNDCATSVQGHIAWNHEGSTGWSDANLAKLCSGQENSTEPGRCFAEVMSGRVSYGGGTRWQPNNALSLCAGAPNAKARIACFSREIAKGTTWNAAIRTCAPPAVAVATPSQAIVAAGAKPAPVPTTPLNTSSAPDPEQLARTQLSKFTCQGPLKFSMNRIPTPREPHLYDFTLEFTAATTARDVQPGQCWRTGGWEEFPRALNRERKGRLIYRVDLRNCTFLESFTVENGRFTDLVTNDTHFGDSWVRQALGIGLRSVYVEATWSDSIGASGGTNSDPVIYVVPPLDHHQPRRPGCG